MSGDRVGGYVLVGGESRRMGEPKALIDVGGHTAAAAVRDRLLAGGCDSATLVASHRSPERIREMSGVLDDGSGPVGAVAAALEHCDLEFAFIVAVDHLGLGSDDVARLISIARSTRDSGPVVCASAPSGRQPLISVWPTSAMIDLVRRRRALGVDSMADLLQEVNVLDVQLPERSCLNVNTPEDLRRLVE